MIVEIEKAVGSTLPALDYNENKVLKGVAELVAYANLECSDHDYIYDTFSRMENTPRIIREMSFHASVNPSEDDSCTQEQVVDFIRLLMETLGYGEQPYLIYRHFDIEREHYHIVSIRADRKGRKINNYFEQRKTSALMKSVCHQYGFSTVAKGHISSLSELSEKADRKTIRSFDPKKDINSQLREICLKALVYDFQNFEQYSRILMDFGVEAVLVSGDDGRHIRLRGLTRDGHNATEMRDEETLAMPLFDMMTEQVSINREFHNKRSREKERVRSIVKSAFMYANSEKHMSNILANKGISVHFSRERESGVLFGVAFVDHVTRTVFKASELGGVISVDLIREAHDTGRWRAEKGECRSAAASESRRQLRKDAISLRDFHVSSVAKILRPVSQPQGDSGNGRVPAMTEDQIRDERLAGQTGSMFASFEDTTYKEKLA